MTYIENKIKSNMVGMFGTCYRIIANSYSLSKGYSLISLNLNNLDTSNVTDMDIMFCGCNSLISLTLNKKTFVNRLMLSIF